jgi:hypothetical protein
VLLRLSPRLQREDVSVKGPQAVFNTSGRLFNFASFPPWAATSPVLSWLLDANTDDALLERFEKLGPLEVANADELRIALPALGGVDEPEFVALLWALLLALSSLVRYEPAYWESRDRPRFVSARGAPLNSSVILQKSSYRVYLTRCSPSVSSQLATAKRASRLCRPYLGQV